MTEPRLPASVQRVLDRHPGMTVVRAQQIAADREKLLRRGVPQLNAKWVVPEGRA